MQLKLIRIVSGQFVLGNCEEITDAETSQKVLQFDTPVELLIQPQQNGQTGIGMIPLNPFADGKNNKIEIKEEHILFECNDIPHQIKSSYIKSTSGLHID